MQVGDYVVSGNASQWGVGKVLENIGKKKLKIFFEFAGEKVLLTEAANLTIAPGISKHPLLDNLVVSTDTKEFIGFQVLEQQFLRKFPRGFEDTEYLAEERDYKVEAANFLDSLLSEEHLSSLIAQGDFDKICDLAQQVVNKTNLIFPNEKMALRDGLKKGASVKQEFSERLFALLFGDGSMKDRFESFVAVLDEIDATKWTTATYFLALSQPKKYPFIKPQNQKDAAKAYSFDIMYSPHPNWDAYERMIAFNEYVAGMLRKHSELAPRDLIDVQGFIWCSLQQD